MNHIRLRESERQVQGIQLERSYAIPQRDTAMVLRLVIRGDGSAVHRGAYLEGGAQTPWMTRNHQIDLGFLPAC